MKRLLKHKALLRLASLLLLGLCCLGIPALAQAPVAPQAPALTISLSPTPSDGGLAAGLQIIALLTVLTLAPAILIMMTSFVRIVVVLGFVRRALATQTVPPNQVLIALSLFLTFFVMAPTWGEVNEQAIQPLLKEEITMTEAYTVAQGPVREFLFKHTRKKDLALFLNVSNTPRPQNKSEVPNHVLVPAFMISELQTAFLIGFIIYVPFLIIDMVISSILLSMGMMMLPPPVVSLPFKIILFVLVDGWNLIVESLVRSIAG